MRQQCHMNLSQEAIEEIFRIQIVTCTFGHTIFKYENPISISELPSLKFGVLPEDITASYFPTIETPYHVLSQCVVYQETGQICRANISYTFIQSNVYIATQKF